MADSNTTEPEVSANTYMVVSGYFAAMFVLLFYLGQKECDRKFKRCCGGRDHGAETIEEHFYGNRNFSGIVLMLSTLASICSGFTINGMPSKVYDEGWKVLLWFANAAPIPLTYMLIAPRLNRLGRAKRYLTPVDFIRDRFGQGDSNKSWVKVLRVLIIFFYLVPCIFYLAAQFLAFNDTFLSTFNIEDITYGEGDSWTTMFRQPRFLCGMVLSIVLVIFEMFGGFKAVVWSDAIQATVLIGSLFVTMALMLWDDKFGGITDGSAAMYDARLVTPDYWNRPNQTTRKNRILDAPEDCGFAIDLLSFAFVAGIGRVCQADVLSRILASSNQNKLKTTTSYLMVLNIVVKIIVTVIGMQAARMYWWGDKEHMDFVPKTAVAKFCTKLTEQGGFSAFVGPLLLSASMAAIMSTADSMLIEVVKFVVFEVLKPIFELFRIGGVDKKTNKMTEKSIMSWAGYLTVGVTLCGFLMSSISYMSETAEKGKHYRTVLQSDELTGFFKLINMYMNAMFPTITLAIFDDHAPAWLAVVSVLFGSWIGITGTLHEFGFKSFLSENRTETLLQMVKIGKPAGDALPLEFLMYHLRRRMELVTLFTNLLLTWTVAIILRQVGTYKSWKDYEPETTHHRKLGIEIHQLQPVKSQESGSGDAAAPHGEGETTKFVIGIWGNKANFLDYFESLCEGVREYRFEAAKAGAGARLAVIGGSRIRHDGDVFANCKALAGMVYLHEGEVYITLDDEKPPQGSHIFGRVVEGVETLEHIEEGMKVVPLEQEQETLQELDLDTEAAKVALRPASFDELRAQAFTEHGEVLPAISRRRRLAAASADTSSAAGRLQVLRKRPKDVDPLDWPGMAWYIGTLVLLVIALPWPFWKPEFEMEECPGSVLFNVFDKLLNETRTKCCPEGSDEVKCAVAGVTGWELSMTGFPPWVNQFLVRIVIVCALTVFIALKKWKSEDGAAKKQLVEEEEAWPCWQAICKALQNCMKSITGGLKTVSKSFANMSSKNPVYGGFRDFVTGLFDPKILVPLCIALCLVFHAYESGADGKAPSHTGKVAGGDGSVSGSSGSCVALLVLAAAVALARARATASGQAAWQGAAVELHQRGA